MTALVIIAYGLAQQGFSFPAATYFQISELFSTLWILNIFFQYLHLLYTKVQNRNVKKKSLSSRSSQFLCRKAVKRVGAVKQKHLWDIELESVSQPPSDWRDIGSLRDIGNPFWGANKFVTLGTFIHDTVTASCNSRTIISGKYERQALNIYL